VVQPVVAASLPPLPESPAALALLVAAEVSIGSFIAVLVRIVVGALQVAGEPDDGSRRRSVHEASCR
jgi:flagellar biosynthesis protein FliR